MLRSLNILTGYTLAARDDDIGRCVDFLFDDRYWCVRYMVADTATWLAGRKVLISPAALQKPNWGNQSFPVNLTKKQIEQSPELDDDAPVSRKYEMLYHKYFGFGFYWNGPGLWGDSADLTGIMQPESIPQTEIENNNQNLRSIKEVKGYRVAAIDQNIGPVYDFIVDDETWAIRYLVVSIRNKIASRKILISPEWIRSVNWVAERVYVAIDEKKIKQSPEVDLGKPVNTEYEKVHYDFYGRPHYWQQKFITPKKKQADNNKLTND